ncbi:MAG TPA: hypothetical protein PKE25_13415 [Novosphingobium sp.]|nr:hypothetical protein [Novosphingobium sp.]
MIRISMPRGMTFLARSAMAVALAGGLGAVALTSVPAEAQRQSAPRLKLSKGFQTLAAPLSQQIEAAKARADVVAAGQQAKDATAAYNAARGDARTAAKARMDAAVDGLGNTLSAEKGQLDAAFAAIAGQDDQYMAGNLAVTLGGLAQDSRLQRRGLQAMIDSGKVGPAEVARFQFFIGNISFELGEYAAARTAIEAAIAGGFTENDPQALLAEAYIADRQVAAGLGVLQKAIEARAAAGNPAPVNWYRRGLGAAYNAKLLDQAVQFSYGLAKAYPSTDNWAGAITVVREIGQFPAQETLDLMRLMDRTNSWSEERDYIEYIQATDPRRLPGEALKAIEAGLAAGKLRANDTFVSDARSLARERLAADQASLPGLERDARLASATGATVSGAADAFLSYGQPAKAEDLYKIALTKPGIDNARVLTRLGIAQYDQGKYAEARETFAKVEGARRHMAQLWALAAEQKSSSAS